MNNIGTNTEFVFTWTIDNGYYFFTGTHLRSPVFKTCGIGQSLWYLRFHRIAHLRYALRLVRSGNCTAGVNINVTFRLSIESPNKMVKQNSVQSTLSFSRGTFYEFEISTVGDIRKHKSMDELKVICKLTRDDIVEVKKLLTIDICEAKTHVRVLRCSNHWDVDTTKRFAGEWMATKIHNLCDGGQIIISLSLRNDLVRFNLSVRNCPPCAIFKLTLLDLDGKEVNSASYGITFKQGNFFFDSFISKSYFQDLKDGILPLLCEISMSNGDSTSEIVKEEFDLLPRNTISRSDPVLTLQTDFNEMFTKNKLFDVELKLSDGTIHAHKSILAARSSIFAGNFTQNITENRSEVEEIPEFDARIFREFLQFLYTGKTSELDFESICQLWTVADKYAVQSLVDECVFLLNLKMTAGNAQQVLIVADLHQNDQLKISAMDYIRRNRI